MRLHDMMGQWKHRRLQWLCVYLQIWTGAFGWRRTQSLFCLFGQVLQHYTPLYWETPAETETWSQNRDAPELSELFWHSSTLLQYCWCLMRRICKASVVFCPIRITSFSFTGEKRRDSSADRCVESFSKFQLKRKNLKHVMIIFVLVSPEIKLCAFQD